MINLDLLTTAEVAVLLGVSPREVARRVSTGSLEAMAKLPGVRGAYVFERAAIEALAGEKS